MHKINSRKKGRLAKLLVKNYFWFTAANLIIIGIIVILSAFFVQALALALANNTIDRHQYIEALKFSGKGWILFIPAYLCVTVLFIKKQVATMKDYLSPINKAIVSIAHGKIGDLSEYQGPDELVEIADNFDYLSARLEESENERKKLDEERQRLLADISHDLKTPITVIQSYAIALQDGIVPQEQIEKYYDTIYQKSRSMVELLSALHEYSKLEHPDFPVKMKPVDICSAVQIYLAGKYEELELGGYSLEVEIPDEKIMCNLDCALFFRGIENLANNGIKYNPKGTELYISIFRQEETVKLIIADNGVGISEEAADIIFKPFNKSETIGRKDGGSGLGLSIVKKIMEAHGGDIRIAAAENEKYKTQFEITLPLIKAEIEE